MRPPPALESRGNCMRAPVSSQRRQEEQNKPRKRWKAIEAKGMKFFRNERERQRQRVFATCSLLWHWSNRSLFLQRSVKGENVKKGEAKREGWSSGPPWTGGRVTFLFLQLKTPLTLCHSLIRAQICVRGRLHVCAQFPIRERSGDYAFRPFVFTPPPTPFLYRLKRKSRDKRRDSRVCFVQLSRGAVVVVVEEGDLKTNFSLLFYVFFRFTRSPVFTKIQQCSV